MLSTNRQTLSKYNFYKNNQHEMISKAFYNKIKIL